MYDLAATWLYLREGLISEIDPLSFEGAKVGRIKRDLRRLLAALQWKPVIAPAWDSLPGSRRVTLISVLLAHLKVGERDELPRREERGNYPAARCQPPWPCV